MTSRRSRTRRPALLGLVRCSPDGRTFLDGVFHPPRRPAWSCAVSIPDCGVEPQVVGSDRRLPWWPVVPPLGPLRDGGARCCLHREPLAAHGQNRRRYRSGWSHRQDSNLLPPLYESGALPVVLRRLAESEGVEPPGLLHPTAFKAARHANDQLSWQSRWDSNPRGCYTYSFSGRAPSTTWLRLLADTVGFEPTEPFDSRAFQARPFNHSGKCPGDPYGTRTRDLLLDREAR